MVILAIVVSIVLLYVAIALIVGAFLTYQIVPTTWREELLVGTLASLWLATGLFILVGYLSKGVAFNLIDPVIIRIESRRSKEGANAGETSSE